MSKPRFAGVARGRMLESHYESWEEVCSLFLTDTRVHGQLGHVHGISKVLWNITDVDRVSFMFNNATADDRQITPNH